MNLKRCPRCHEEKDPDQFLASHSYCRVCLSEYRRDRKERRKKVKDMLKNVEPLGEDRPRGRPKKTEGKPAQRKVAKSNPVPARRKNTRCLTIVPSRLKAPVIVDGQAETVEQFIARGGSIQVVPFGVVSRMVCDESSVDE